MILARDHDEAVQHDALVRHAIGKRQQDIDGDVDFASCQVARESPAIEPQRDEIRPGRQRAERDGQRGQHGRFQRRAHADAKLALARRCIETARLTERALQGAQRLPDRTGNRPGERRRGDASALTLDSGSPSKSRRRPSAWLTAGWDRFSLRLAIVMPPRCRRYRTPRAGSRRLFDRCMARMDNHQNIALGLFYEWLRLGASNPQTANRE